MKLIWGQCPISWFLNCASCANKSSWGMCLRIISRRGKISGKIYPRRRCVCTHSSVAGHVKKDALRPWSARPGPTFVRQDVKIIDFLQMRSASRTAAGDGKIISVSNDRWKTLNAPICPKWEYFSNIFQSPKDKWYCSNFTHTTPSPDRWNITGDFLRQLL